MRGACFVSQQNMYCERAILQPEYLVQKKEKCWHGMEEQTDTQQIQSNFWFINKIENRPLFHYGYECALFLLYESGLKAKKHFENDHSFWTNWVDR